VTVSGHPVALSDERPYRVQNPILGLLPVCSPLTHDIKEPKGGSGGTRAKLIAFILVRASTNGILDLLAGS
jgi:hypothetical protein